MEANQSFFDKALSNRTLNHLLFWLFFIVIQTQVFLYTDSSFKVILIFTSAMLPSVMMAAYLLTYYQVPKLLLKGKYWQFISSLLVSAYLFTVLARIMTVFVAEPLLGLQDAVPPSEMILRILNSPDRLARNYLLSVYLAPAAMVIIKLLKQKTVERQRLEALEKEKATTELNFLKAQIHPHFLLNTLNNIYALTLKKSDQAPETVLKLSEMLTYVLYKCNEQFVPLRSEIELIENYISLERIRYQESFKLNFHKNVDPDTNLKIAPLILLSIVENAFKHGVSSDVHTPEITINLTTSMDVISFSVYNTKSKTKQKDEQEYTKGIGSKNVKKQLDLLYPGRYTYQITEEAEWYRVDLKVNLNEK